MRLAAAGLLCLLVPWLGGCKFAGELVGAGAGGASAAATANPAVGIAVGVAVNAGVNATFDYILRKRQQAEQDAIAEQVAMMQPGDRRAWKIEHTLPIGNEHGEVAVTRAIISPLTLCKELVFSVDTGNGAAMTRHWYTTNACREGERWKWALAEPAVARWGALQ